MRLVHLFASLTAGFVFLTAPVAPLAQAPPRPDATVEAQDIGSHHQVWRWSSSVPDGLGAWRAEHHSLVELATGLNRWDAQTESYVPARAEFESTASGHWIARHTAHQVILPADLAGGEPVDLLAPDGVRLHWSVLGLALLDRATGQSVWLARPQASLGERIGEDEVIFADALDDVAADIRYRLTLCGVEQDVILRERTAPRKRSTTSPPPSVISIGGCRSGSRWTAA